MFAEIATHIGSNVDSGALAHVLGAACTLLAGVAAVISSDTGNNKPTKHKVRRVATPKPKTICMSVEEWAQVPSNPKQPRDHALRAMSPKAKHLWTFVPQAHDRVKMAIDRHGNRWKITGHTRGEVWSRGLSNVVPKTVYAEVVYVDNDADAGERCIKLEDSREAVNTPSDLVHGALMFQGVSMTSNLLKKATGLPTALRYAYEIYVASMRAAKTPGHEKLPSQKLSTHEDRVRVFHAALNALDGLQPNQKKNGVRLFNGALLTAFLLSYLKYGNRVLSFYERLNDGDCGQKKGKRYDPVGYVERLLSSKEVGARKDHLTLVSMLLAALENYLSHPTCNARDENGKSAYQPILDCSKEMTVDLDVYLTAKRVKRTNRDERNSLIKGG